MNLRISFLIALIIFACTCPFALASTPQGRDHLSLKEVDLVKEAQELDRRTDVFIKAVNRRLLVIKGMDATSAKEIRKDAELWGDLPSGSRSDLLGDIAKILDEAITNIDDVSARDEKNPLIPKSLRKLAGAATHVVEQLKPLQASATDDIEMGNLEQLLSNADEIIQAAAKLSPETPKKGKNKGDKAKGSN